MKSFILQSNKSDPFKGECHLKNGEIKKLNISEYITTRGWGSQRK